MAWVWIVGLAIVLCAAFATHLTLGLITTGVLLALFLGDRREKQKMARLRADRGPVDLAEFDRLLSDPYANPAVTKAVFDLIVAYVTETGKSSVPLYPDDHFYNDLMLDPDDIEMDAFAHLSDELGTSTDHAECKENPYYNCVETPRGLIGYFSVQPPARP